jgi:hypothetical protein
VGFRAASADAQAETDFRQVAENLIGFGRRLSNDIQEHLANYYSGTICYASSCRFGWKTNLHICSFDMSNIKLKRPTLAG